MSILGEVNTWLEGEESKTDSLEHLTKHGCVSGSALPMVYYSDTIPFYERNKEEINELLKEHLQSTGENGDLSGIFGGKFDKEDPLCLEQSNQNLLAWFGFETVASQYGDELIQMETEQIISVLKQGGTLIMHSEDAQSLKNMFSTPEDAALACGVRVVVDKTGCLPQGKMVAVMPEEKSVFMWSKDHE